MSENPWLGPTYEFHSGQWLLMAGVLADGGRLEWLLTEHEGQTEPVSQSFVLEPNATAADLDEVLGELPEEVRSDLVAQVVAQTDPRLLSREGMEEGLA